jgi:cardiolipin synthase
LQLNIPTALTWFRILLIPVFVAVYYFPESWMTWPTKNFTGAALFGAAAITDWFDGWLARRLSQTSAFGAFLDPVADKLMVAAALIVLINLDRCHPVVGIIIIGREITISALREWMAQIGKSKSVAVAMLGKVKTVAQMVAIVVLLMWEPVIPGVSTAVLGTVLIWGAAVLTLWSMIYYWRLAAPHLRA